jgi:hypothetical protein
LGIFQKKISIGFELYNGANAIFFLENFFVMPPAIKRDAEDKIKIKFQ